MPTINHAFVAGLIMLASGAPGAQGARAQPLDAYEAATGFRGSDVASVITRIVERQLLAIPGVRSVHDLHVRSITSGIDAMSAHVVVTDMAELLGCCPAFQERPLRQPIMLNWPAVAENGAISFQTAWSTRER